MGLAALMLLLKQQRAKKRSSCETFQPMMTLDVPTDEAGRLQALVDLDAFNADHEPTLTGLVEAAASVCGVPISLISLVDDDRQWFKANVGLEATKGTPREVAASCGRSCAGAGVNETCQGAICQ